MCWKESAPRTCGLSLAASVYFPCLLLHRHARAPKTNLGPTRIVLGFRRGAFFSDARTLVWFFPRSVQSGASSRPNMEAPPPQRKFPSRSTSGEYEGINSGALERDMSETLFIAIRQLSFSLFVGGGGGAAPDSQQVSRSLVSVLLILSFIYVYCSTHACRFIVTTNSWRENSFTSSMELNARGTRAIRTF